MVVILEKMNRLVPGKNISLKDDKLEILKLKKKIVLDSFLPYTKF